jgi:hypothetical protein
LEREILERVYNLISKLFRNPEAVPIVLKQRHTIFKAILYFNKEFKGELQMNALRTLHPLMRHPDFKKTCFEEHKFTKSMFDAYVKEVLLIFNESIKAGSENWTDFINACGSIVAFVVAFPERLVEFQDIIVPLIGIVKDKTEIVRKNAAILLAQLAKEESNEKVMRANHGFDVLLSLRQQFGVGAN